MTTTCVKLHNFRGLLSIIVGMVIGDGSIYLRSGQKDGLVLIRRKIIIMIGSLLEISHNHLEKTKMFGHILEGCMSLLLVLILVAMATCLVLGCSCRDVSKQRQINQRNN